MIAALCGPTVRIGSAFDDRGAVIETYCMLGREREAELLREAQRLHALGPSAFSRIGPGVARIIDRAGHLVGSSRRRTRRRVSVADSS
jgi:hypothetical protein